MEDMLADPLPKIRSDDLSDFEFNPVRIHLRRVPEFQQVDIDPSLHPALGPIFAARGVFQFRVSDYSLEHIIPPFELKGLDKACALLFGAFQQQQNGLRDGSAQVQPKILVVGDFDVDGATSVAVALRGLRAMGFCVDYFIPDRFHLGYGLSPAVVEAAASFDPTILITVDNGIASVDGVAAAKARGWQVIVTDHHLAGDVLPDADAIINPNQPGCHFPSKHLAGVGVIFYLLIGFRRYCREQGVHGQFLPNLAQLLDLVALGTVADMVPLDANNRRLVSLGLARIRAGFGCAGIQALAEVAGRDVGQLSEGDLGFSIGPRLNAAGRLEDMSIGVQCLLSDQWDKALSHARQLDGLNRERRKIQEDMQDQADELLLSLADDLSSQRAIVVYQPHWHQGVVGLLASRLKDRWHRPVIALAKVNDYELKGSGRSVPGVHLRDALDLVSKRAPQVLNKFGGHAMAAGLSVSVDQLDRFEAVFQQVMDKLVRPEHLAQVHLSDGMLAEDDMSLKLALDIEKVGPWGQAFPEPRFHGHFRVVSCEWLKTKHLKFRLQRLDCQVDVSKAVVFEALYFHVPLGLYHRDESQARRLIERLAALRCVYKLGLNRFRGQLRLQLMLEYLEPVSVVS